MSFSSPFSILLVGYEMSYIIPSTIIISSSVGTCPGLDRNVSFNVFFNLTQHGLNDAYVIPPPITPPATGIAFLKNPVKT